MRKLILKIIVAWVIFLLFFLGYPYYHDMRLKKRLFNRSDYPQIAAACVKLANTVTTEEGLHPAPSDPSIPPLLRSLSPQYIRCRSNYVLLGFGGMGRYTYTVLQSTNDPKVWTLDINSPEQFGNRPLTIITNN